MTTGSTPHDRIDEALAALSLEEKAHLLTGADFWHTAAVDHAGVPAVMMTDGPYGLRKQAEDASDHLGIGDSVPATAFPPPVALGASMDPTLVERVGAAIGAEALQEQVSVVLGPGVNIKRSPLCGRNFEYYSEDPLVAGVMGAAWVRGIQSTGVGASLKHFAANNQETRRNSVSADVDERPLHETYLRAFEHIVRTEQPWTVMCSYNRVNGTFASENHLLLTELLRGQWGFEGVVVSDWTAVLDRVRSLRAGLDLEMPSTGEVGPGEVVAAVRSGEVPEDLVDASVRRLLELVFRSADHLDPTARYDADAHHALAREVAGRGIVLLRNEGDLLPLDPSARLAVIGEFARTPRFQGAGSSQIVPTRMEDALDALRADTSGEVLFAPGFRLDGEEDEALVAEAVEAASRADVAVVFLGLSDREESEGYDRTTIDLPLVQVGLLRRVLEANPRTVVVLSNGSAVRLSPWSDGVPALVEGWLLGQAGGAAVADVLLGSVNPSARLTETLPLRLEDTPAHLNFPGEHDHVRYGEGIHVGYRWYDGRGLDVAFPFGHGLSYTTFEYDSLALRWEGGSAGEGGAAGTDGDAGDGALVVHLGITNTGTRDGREVAQVYADPAASSVSRPPRELRAFASIEVPAGERVEVEVRVPRPDLAHWDDRVHRWVVEGGDWVVEVGASSRDIRLAGSIEVVGDEVRTELDRDSTFDEWMADPVGGPLLREVLAGGTGTAGTQDAGAGADGPGGSGGVSAEGSSHGVAGGEGTPDHGAMSLLEMLGGMRLGQVVSFPMVPLAEDRVEAMVAEVRASRPRP
ncbi:glycoside hydrolase family 3 C-terminal domain-containing protein [Actinomyces polynesiensis]|uniref:glycoside hydrolase family 3 C-terminal domain-containing protein n=1 Tax=Actinomyces polynesiensis TaxID=1325934 RepID=UPI000694E7BE|nr:glycoside hydrolase family 3 C-terminal domain-containing protein [Actinomyces polynesiensis]